MAGEAGRDGETLLTPREAEVLSLLREGRTNAEIAGRLGITLDGAKYHVSQIIAKLGVRNRYQAARWPERSPWWLGALAPLALVWRKARMVALPKLSAVALGASAVVLVAVLAGAGLVAFGLVRGGNEDSQAAPTSVLFANRLQLAIEFDPETDSPVLRDLGPGATFHTVALRYRRHGPAGSEIPPDVYLPEWVRNEAWITYDSEGALVSLLSETRDLEGALLRTSALEGDDLVYRNADGTLRSGESIAGFFREGSTVDDLRTTLLAGYAELVARVAAADVRPGTLGSESVLVMEARKEFRGLPSATFPGADGSVETASPVGYSSPYLADLSPAEEILRTYIREEDFLSVKWETVIVGEDGTETVVESREYEVFEAIAER